MTWALATIAALLIAYATVSRRLEGLNVSGAMFFTTAGLLAGPVLGLLDLQVRGEQVKLLAEITLTLVLSPTRRASRCARSATSPRCRCACWESACRSRSSPER
jgi:hypothetical protein